MDTKTNYKKQAGSNESGTESNHLEETDRLVGFPLKI
jgi:hypothetical protein